MPIARVSANGSPLTQQLIRSASIFVLENQAAGRRPRRLALWRSPRRAGRISARRSSTGSTRPRESLALAIAAATAVIDFEAVIVDGAFPADVGARIVERDRRSLEPPRSAGPVAGGLVQGAVGADARAIGGACLPLLAKFGRDQEVLLKDNGSSPAGGSGPAPGRR